MANDNKYIPSSAAAVNPNIYVPSSTFANRGGNPNKYVPSSTYADVPAGTEDTTDIEGLTNVSPTAGTYVSSSTFADVANKIIPTGPTGPTGPAGATEDTGPTGATATLPIAPPAIDPDVYANKVSAFNILKEEFDRYGLGSLVEGIRGLLTDGTPASEFALKLRETPQYQARFSANEARIKAGLAALSPAEYVALEDGYQNIMRNYGLPKSYYEQTIDPVTGVKKQVGFDKLLSADVSAAELEDRIATAQQRVINSNPEVIKALRQFYPDISNADILAYTLDPQNGLDNIKRKVTAAEIGGAALQQGLMALGGSAESLAAQGITKAQAQAGYADIAQMLPRGSELAAIYGESPYTQQTAEAEAFGTAGAADAARKRKKLAALETAQFSGSSGVGALGKDKANPYGTTQSGYGSY